MPKENIARILLELYQSKASMQDANYIQQLQIIFPVKTNKSINLNEISSIQKKQIQAVFEERHNAYLGTPIFYTSTIPQADEANHLWIKLAEAFCAKDSLYTMHHYQLLMPSVENLDEFEIIQREHIKNLPLFQLLLTENKKMLVSLDSAINCAKASRMLAVYCSTTYHPDQNGLYEFSEQDKKFFQQTNPDLWSQYYESETKLAQCPEPTITKDTVYALILAVESATFKKGLQEDYNKSMLNTASDAYNRLELYLNTISDDEKNSLMNQNIRWLVKEPYNVYFGNVRFEEVWEDIRAGNRCVAYAAQDLARIILAYEPRYTFQSNSLRAYAENENTKNALVEKTYSTRSPFGHQLSSETYHHYRLLQLMRFLLNKDQSGEHEAMLNCLVDGLKKRTYLETYYDILLHHAIGEINLYRREGFEPYQQRFFNKNSHKKKNPSEEIAYQILHEGFLQQILEDNICSASLQELENKLMHHYQEFQAKMDASQDDTPLLFEKSNNQSKGCLNNILECLLS